MITFSQSTKNGFSKKALTGFEKYWVRINPSKAWNGKLEVATLLPSKSMYRQCDKAIPSKLYFKNFPKYSHL